MPHCQYYETFKIIGLCVVCIASAILWQMIPSKPEIRDNNDSKLYVYDEPLEYDYPLIVIGGSSITAKIPPYLPKIEVLASPGGEVNYRYLIRQKYPEMADLLIDLSKCESGLNDERWGDSGKSHGLFQYQEATFKGYCTGDWHNGEDQLDCAVKMIKMGIGPTPGGWYNCWRIENLFKYD